VDPKAGLNDVEKRKFLTLSGLELRPLGPRDLLSHRFGFSVREASFGRMFSVSSPFCYSVSQTCRDFP
jgi:hypothetical protein